MVWKPSENELTRCDTKAVFLLLSDMPGSAGEAGIDQGSALSEGRIVRDDFLEERNGLGSSTFRYRLFAPHFLISDFNCKIVVAVFPLVCLQKTEIPIQDQGRSADHSAARNRFPRVRSAVNML